MTHFQKLLVEIYDFEILNVHQLLQMNVISDSGMDTDDLMRQMNQAKAIANYGKDQTKLIEAFQNKIQELLQYREEVINLQSQLQISRDSQKMIEAEFAFQKADMEAEIEKRKKTEQDLRDALLLKESEMITQANKYDVNASVVVKEKYKRWKQIAEETSQQVEDLKHKEKELQNDLEKKNSIIEKMKAQLKDSHTNEEVQNLQNHIQKLQNKINRRNKVIAQLQEQNEQLQESANHSFQDDNRTEKNENERLKMKLERVVKQLEKQKQIEEKLQNLQELNHHYEMEREVLDDIFQIEKYDPSREWTPLRQKAKDGMEAIAKLDESSAWLESAGKMISEFQNSSLIIDELKKKINDNEEKITNYDNLCEKLTKTENEFEAYKIETEKIYSFNEQQRIRCNFTKIVSENQKTIISAISDLHYSLTGEKFQFLRPIVLASVFCQRWLNIIKKQRTKFDEASLIAFTSMPSYTIETKLNMIQDIFVSLSNNVLKTKVSLQKAYSKIEKLKKFINDLVGNIEMNKSELENIYKKCTFYKQTIKDLNYQIATFVAPESFQSSLSRVTDLEIAIDTLNKQISTQNNLIQNKDDMIKSLKADIKKAEIQHNDDYSKINSIEKALKEKNDELEIAKMKLKERTKELLSLERTLQINQSDLFTKRENNNLGDNEQKSIENINPNFLVELQ